MSQAETLTRLSRDPRRKVTYEEFLEGDWGTQHVEWVNGEVRMMAAVSGEHDDITVFLLTIVHTYVQAKRLGVVRKEPFQMKTGPGLPGRSPDVMFIANANVPNLRKNYLDGPADLVVEVISPGTVEIDRGEKFGEYAHGGVKEYWLVDPLQKRADFFLRGDDAVFRPMPVAIGVFHSHVLAGLWLRVEWLWNRPDIIGVLKEWGLV